jgi:hypothetical protein
MANRLRQGGKLFVGILALDRTKVGLHARRRATVSRCVFIHRRLTIKHRPALVKVRHGYSAPRFRPARAEGCFFDAPRLRRMNCAGGRVARKLFTCKERSARDLAPGINGAHSWQVPKERP